MRSIVVYGNYHNVYIARSPDDKVPIDVTSGDGLEELDGEAIPLDFIFPTFDENIFTRAPNPPLDGFFIKCANTLAYAIDGKRDNSISELIYYEAIACEDLLRHPHPNIAQYFGCQVINNRIVGLCFKEYQETLNERLEHDCNTIGIEKCLTDIRMGIAHMHQVGYAHNDINPRNVMFDSDGKAVLIDFDSCRPLGNKLGRKSGTKGFYIKSATTSEKQNSYYGLAMIERNLKERIDV